MLTVAAMPLNVTMLFAGTGEKLLPEITTVTPGAPSAGEKLLIVGGEIVNDCVLVRCPVPLMFKETVPVVAALGTSTTNCFGVAAVTFAVTPLNFTTLLARVGSKPSPVIVTDVPAAPEVGEKLENDDEIVKVLADVAVLPPTVTVTFPDVEVAGNITLS